MKNRLFKRFPDSSVRALLLGAGLACLPGAADVSGAAERVPDVWARAVHHEDGSKTVSTRDSNARLIESETYDKNEQLVMKRVLQTDAKGQPKRGFVFDKEEKLIYRLGFEYDEIGRSKTTTLFDPAGEVVMKVDHHFNTKGQELTPSVQKYKTMPVLPGQIRPGAAMARPGSTEAVLQGAPAAAPPPAAADPPKKKKFFRLFRKR